MEILGIIIFAIALIGETASDEQLQSFKRAQRVNDEAAVMRKIASALTEQEMVSLADFLARMPLDTKH